MSQHLELNDIIELIEKIVVSNPNNVKVNWKNLLKLISTLGITHRKNFNDSMNTFFENKLAEYVEYPEAKNREIMITIILARQWHLQTTYTKFLIDHVIKSKDLGLCPKRLPNLIKIFVKLVPYEPEWVMKIHYNNRFQTCPKNREAANEYYMLLQTRLKDLKEDDNKKLLDGNW